MSHAEREPGSQSAWVWMSVHIRLLCRPEHHLCALHCGAGAGGRRTSLSSTTLTIT